jgi:hypothetical protein
MTEMEKRSKVRDRETRCPLIVVPLIVVTIIPAVDADADVTHSLSLILVVLFDCNVDCSSHHG